MEICSEGASEQLRIKCVEWVYELGEYKGNSGTKNMKGRKDESENLNSCFGGCSGVIIVVQ